MTRVAMFVTNPCTHDARVMKEAKSLVDAGFEVRVFALSNAVYPEGVFKQNGYTVQRLKFASVFVRVQAFIWRMVALFFAPIRFLVKTIRNTFSVLMELSIVGVGALILGFGLVWTFILRLIASALTPFSPVAGKYVHRLSTGGWRAMDVREAPDPEEPIRQRSVRLFKKRVQGYKVSVYRWLKGRLPFRVRLIIQRAIVFGFKALRWIYKLVFLFYRTAVAVFRKSYRLVRRSIRILYSKAYSALVRWRRKIVAKINRAVYVLLLPMHKFTTYWFFCRNAAEQAIAWHPDVAHAHDLNTMYAAKLVKDSICAKVVYDSHELWVHRNRVGRKATIEKIIDRYAEKRLIRYADAIITVCDSISTWLKDHYADIPEPIILRNMPHRMNAAQLADGIEPLGKRLNIAEGNATMIYTGKITSGRGIEIGVDALLSLDKLHFVLLGYGEQGYVHDLKRKIDELGLDDRVTFCDPVPHTEVTNFIYGADFALVYIEPICLSYEYALPNKLFESIQAGIPIMGSKLIEIQKLVEGRNLGLCFSSAQELADKVRQGLNENMLNTWRNSIRLSQAELCWDVEQIRLINMYEALVA